ncbi:MAG: type II toxin-antitoxin system PemK/MazF family toxin [Beijerinckiaceae bacterium]
MATFDALSLRQGDVVVVPFPYSDRRAEKRRPGLVVSNAALHELGFVWIAMITSASHAPTPADVVISDGGAAGLSAPSRVRASKIACIEPGRIRSCIGNIGAADTREALALVASYVSAAGE